MRRRQWGVGLVAVLIGLGVVGVLRGQDTDEFLASAREPDLVRLLDDLQSRQTRLDGEILRLQAAEQRLRTGTSAEALQEAQERADVEGIEAAGRALEVRLRAEAKTLREKYIAPPHTTDFGLLYLPTEGLYAEVLRRPGLVEALQRDHRVTVAGPTTLLAMLNSFQMGFRTLAIEQRSSEVWELLGAVKNEFGKFGQVLAKTRQQLQTVANTIVEAETRTRQMERKLKQVEALPEPQAAKLIGTGQDDAEPGASG